MECKKKLIFLGPPGAGKGTQASALADKLHMAHLSTGEILREAVKNSTKLGLQAQAYMQKGELVPDALVLGIVVEKLEQCKNQGIILDGFPRTLVQAEQLDQALQKLNLAIDYIVYFRTSPEISIQRLSGRWVCRGCAKNFHSKNMPPKKEGICDDCGGQLYQRDDDKIDTIKNRLKIYDVQTAPLIAFYQKKGNIHEVPGDKEFAEVNMLLMKMLL